VGSPVDPVIEGSMHDQEPRSSSTLGRLLRYRPSLRYELVGCALHGHELLGTDATHVRELDAVFVHQADGFRWYRCLRCDSWLPLPNPEHPTRENPPERDQIDLPLRGRPLRDRYVLRTICVERAIHVLVLGGLTIAVFLFALHRAQLHHEYTKVLTDLQGGLGGPVVSSRSGVVNDINRLFALPPWELYVIGVGLGIYTALLIVEIVGLWNARRWAEYLTFVETGVLVPYELYELAGGVSVLKALTFAINLAVLAYLLFAHHLFGVRGGVKAVEELRMRDTGWEPLEDASFPGLMAAGQQNATSAASGVSISEVG
jgi:uncharacterized membrane protein (DUF2068 family)